MVQQDNSADQIVDNAVAEGGAYEVIRKRLIDQGQTLSGKTRNLNQARLSEFGSSDMRVAARVRVRTENNCVARDIVQVGGHLLFGYNVFIGLKKETRVEDVFALFDIKEEESGIEMVSVPLADSFLSDTSFRNDFDELYRYYKHTKLIQLTVKNGKLLAGFQIGERLEDIRVFRWSIAADGSAIKYIDNRGERDIQLPPEYDFEWIQAAREDTVHGRHPHLNILDKVFVETLGGDLTVKIENNTEDGLGIYREPVEDKTQSLDDAQFFYAQVGSLILLKILPYQEDEWRYLVYNWVTESVQRIDAIGQSCVQLPEDHGLVFPGGYYLQTGEFKSFNNERAELKFKRVIRSPNGEDVLYVFYEPGEGVVGLFAYNMINKELQNPIYSHGYALGDNGRLIVFTAELEPTRVHPMQIWDTPYASAEFASKASASQSFYGRIGNAELVRGVSDLFSICRMIDNQSVSARLYEELSRSALKIFDDHYWVEDEEVQGIAELLKEIADTSELVIDEFEKVQSIRQQSATAMLEAEREQEEIITSIQTASWEQAEEYVSALTRIRHQRGHLATIKELRYIEQERIGELDNQLMSAEEELSERTVHFLSDEQALNPYLDKIDRINKEVAEAKTKVELEPPVEQIEATALALDLLSELMTTLKVQDATVRTRVIDTISGVYSKLNQSKASAKHKQKGLGSEEAIAQFGAQFKLFSQSITNALGLATTPERCDEQLARLLVQLEELESQFSNFDQFLGDIVEKREEIHETFEAHKQQLLDERQRKAQSISDAADRILSSIEKRSLKFTDTDELNTFFASDALVRKVFELVDQLRDLESAVKADDFDARFKAVKEQALRSLRDKTDIYEEGGNVIKLGPRHKFSVNNQELDLTIIPRNGELSLHLTGTDYYEEIEHPDLIELRDYWEISIESETADLYRSEYLAYSILQSAKNRQHGISDERLKQALREDADLTALVSQFAAPRYKEGYEKGVHDHDAALFLKQLIPAIERADLLAYDPLCRGLAQVFWSNIKKFTENRGNNNIPAPAYLTWHERAVSASQMQSVFESTKAQELLTDEVQAELARFVEQHPLPVSVLDIGRAAEYLVAELGRDRIEFIGSKYAIRLVEELKGFLDENTWRNHLAALKNILGWPAERWKISQAWFQALVDKRELEELAHYIPEAVAMLNCEERLDRRSTEADLELTVDGLLGDHPSIQNRELSFALDTFLQRLDKHCLETIPAYQRFQQTRQRMVAQERGRLGLDGFKARPLSSFVRNRLINESYLPLIGDNLAKQMGTVGEDKRTDLMGLLMMISPPGYGKTTLMEYVANRLGLIFMKINCPALGHSVHSLDPEQAPNSTARQELEKLNLALEMGNNVMLYLDDIQHTHPEFLQKFISLCDGTRRIEGIWKGKTKTYDMRGRKFCVVMAGNPYTESGESFKVPDMLANRADIYNLGDILGGMDEQFALSYIENSLTSNPILAPLAVRDMGDVYKLVDMARGKEIATTDLKHQYSGAEIGEITEVLKKLFVIQDVVLKINQQYIASAAQSDDYRVEPSFKLQGSYRNMNKMAEKVTAVMNDKELMQMIADHYLGEAQLLTSGAEDNLLKLAELRGNITEEEQQRWQQIKKDFLRNKAMGGSDIDVGGKVVAQLTDLVEGVRLLGDVTQTSLKESVQETDNTENLQLQKSLERLVEAVVQNQGKVEVINQPVPGLDKILTVLAETIEGSIFPLVRSMDKKLEIDLRTHDRMQEVSDQLRQLKAEVADSAKKAKTAKSTRSRPKA